MREGTTKFYSDFGEVEAIGVGTLEPECFPPLSNVLPLTTTPLQLRGQWGRRVPKE